VLVGAQLDLDAIVSNIVTRAGHWQLLRKRS